MIGKELVVEIEDDGVGREKSKALKTKNQKQYKSTGLNNTKKRIDLINNVYKKNYSVDISNLHEDREEKGTKVVLKIV